MNTITMIVCGVLLGIILVALYIFYSKRKEEEEKNAVPRFQLASELGIFLRGNGQWSLNLVEKHLSDMNAYQNGDAPHDFRQITGTPGDNTLLYDIAKPCALVNWKEEKIVLLSEDHLVGEEIWMRYYHESEANDDDNAEVSEEKNWHYCTLTAVSYKEALEEVIAAKH